MRRGRPPGRGGGGRGRGHVVVPPVMAPPAYELAPNSSRIPIPVFDPDNYHIWAFEMQSYMSAEGCFGPIDEQTNGWATADEAVKTSMRLQAFNLLRFSLGPTYQYISGEHQIGEARPLWDHIRQMYVRNDMDTHLRLDSRFQALYWDRTRHHVDSFLADLSKIRAEYRSAGFDMPERMVFTKLLSCLPEQFDIEASKMRDWDHPDLARARMLLKNREDILRGRRQSESSQPLLEGSNFSLSNKSSNSSFVSNTDPSSASAMPKGRRRMRCFFCKRAGHKKIDCIQWKRWQENSVTRKTVEQDEKENPDPSILEKLSRSQRRDGRNKGAMRSKGHVQVLKQDHRSTLRSSSEEGEEGDQGYVFLTMGVTTHEDSLLKGACLMMSQPMVEGWILDTGATHHLCKDIECLTDVERTKVCLETGKSSAALTVDTCGKVVMGTRREGLKPVTLKHVLYSPEASSNIVALKPFIDKGCYVGILGTKMTVHYEGKVVLSGTANAKGLYVLDSHIPKCEGGSCLTFKEMGKYDTLRILHNRLCHLHPNVIRTMIKEDMVKGLPDDLKLDDIILNCPSCVEGKMTRKPYRKVTVYADGDEDVTPPEVGDEVCSDTFGPISTTSRYGNKHIVEFIDQASKFAFLFGIPSLDVVVSKYILVRNIFDTQLRVKIKLFRSDGHGCYDNNDMKVILAGDGTLHKMRSPYCPEQNAVAERRIKTVVEMARTMLLHSCAPIYCWEDAVLHANYVRNRVATRALRGMTPFQRFWKRKPDLQWLKPFGCLVYVLIHKEIRGGKFDAAALPGILMGISDTHNGYKVHMLHNGSIKIARDVQFYEDIYPFRKSPSTDLQWMNPLDCPRSLDSTEKGGSFVDPFVRLDIPSSEARRNTELADLYRRTNETIQEPNLKKRKVGCSVSDNEGVVNTSFVAEGVKQATSKNPMEISSFALDSDDKGSKSKSSPLEDLMGEGVILNIVEMQLEKEMNGPDKDKWIEAFHVEYGAVMKTKTFTKITPEAQKMLREGKIRVHHTRPILTHKYNEAGEIARFKVRLVVKGFTMQQRVDYDKTFSPCARMVTVRMIIAWATAFGWDVTHSDVPNAYLNGKTPHLVLIRLPAMWNEIVGDEIGKDGDPAIMSNSLYGAPDAGRNWNSTYTKAFLDEGYTQCRKEPCVFYKGSFPKIAVFVVWVDDGFATGGDKAELERMHLCLKEKFNVKVLGKVSYALGISFAWKEGGVKMTQTAFIDKIVSRFRMEGSRPQSLPLQKGFKAVKAMCPKDDTEREEMKKVPYRSAIGSLLYIALGTRPDIAYAVCSLARFSHDPGRAHWTGVKCVISYLMNTREMGLTYEAPSNEIDISDAVPNGFSDSSFNDSDDGRSTLGYVTLVHKYPISWKSKVSGRACPVPSPLRIDNRACVLSIDDRVTEANKHFRPKYFLVVERAKANE
ncbi:hypothetical protein M569_16339, partial [Genlisea aurea]